ncbi:MAG: CPBP family intramembrane metalloprotease [Candidatus Pacearchaeota archaeon]|nr:CPBP family intramembrane metalloprotease [Candidatus Pacearchaeota archaeon]
MELLKKHYELIIKNITARLTKNPITYFFILSFLISWILWIPLLYGHFRFGWTSWEGNPWTNYRTLLGILGALGPAISAIIMTNLIHGKNGIKILLKRVIQWRVNALWWLIAFYSWWLISSILAISLSLKPTPDITMGFVFALINIPGMLIIQLPLLVGIFGEELGWRGFALPKLLNKFDPIVSSLILTLPWIFWHAPLMLFQNWRGNLPIVSFLFNYIILLVPLALIFTWFFRKTKGSVLLAIIFHSSLNLTFNAYSIALDLSESASKLLRDYTIYALWIIAMIIVIHYYFKKWKQKNRNKK